MKSSQRVLPCLIPGALSDLFVDVSQSHSITLADRYGLMAALMSDHLQEEELASINRLLRSIRIGKIQIINEISQLTVNHY